MFLPFIPSAAYSSSASVNYVVRCDRFFIPYSIAVGKVASTIPPIIFSSIGGPWIKYIVSWSRSSNPVPPRVPADFIKRFIPALGFAISYKIAEYILVAVCLIAESIASWNNLKKIIFQHCPITNSVNCDQLFLNILEKYGPVIPRVAYVRSNFYERSLAD